MTDAREILATLVRDGVTKFQSSDPQLRDQARRSGWSGSLRGPLHLDDHDGASPPAPAPASVPETIARLVPVVTVTTKRGRSGGIGGLVRHALAGMSDTTEVVVHDGTGLRPFTVRYPDRPELFVEELARAVDVATGFRARFGAAIEHVRLIAFDHGQQGFKSAHYSGMAAPILGDVHLNASMFLPRERAEPAAAGVDRAAEPSRPRPARAPGIYTSTDRTTAHEFWHQLELAFTTRQYTASIEFRRQVGAYFGVETVEHVIQRGGPARDRLIGEVSAYAATNALEATAEMARLWWCGNETPVAQHFGQVVDQFFPEPRR